VLPLHCYPAPSQTASIMTKANILLVGGGAVGAIAAVNLEVGGLAAVTAVLRSNFQAVTEHGYNIESVDHGKLPGWRPSIGMSYHLLLNFPC